MNQSLTYEFAAVMPLALETGLFTVTASFYDRIGGSNSMGQVNNTRVPVPGLQNITAMFGVARMSNAFLPTEGARMPSNYQESPDFHLLLEGYYPAVLPRYTVEISGDSNTYEITPGTVQSDSQKVQTRCKLQRYSL